MKLNLFLLVLMIGVFSLSLGTDTGAKESDTIQSHIDKAYALAGDSFLRKTVDLQCTDSVDAMSFFKNTTVPPATQVFDNLYFVGISSVSAWALQTKEGIILIDALNNTEQAQDVIEAGLLKLGLDPADIKYIVVTQGHGDHYGGSRYFVEKYGTRVLMSESDWNMAINPRPPPKVAGLEAPKWSDSPDKDIVAVDRQELTLGDTTLRIVSTPGHTPGTISVVFPVIRNGERHMAGLWGGTGLPKDLAGVRQYIESADKFLTVLEKEHVDVAVSNHPFVDDSLERMSELRENPAANPFVIGEDGGHRYAKVISECARATLAKREMTGSK
jgi:metallo-beta-lactamase class B